MKLKNEYNQKYLLIKRGKQLLCQFLWTDMMFQNLLQQSMLRNYIRQI